MQDEMKTEAMEVCATACEKFANNNEVTALESLNFIKAKKNLNSQIINLNH